MILSFFWYPRRGADAEADAPRSKQHRPAAVKRQVTTQSKRPTRREQVERADTGKTRRSKQSSR
jgi:hypothetical protein